MSVRREVAAGIDSVVRRPVLVVGSAPPHGRDLDLLARSQEHARIAAWLAEHGFVERRRRWARFDGTAVEAVELFDTVDWFAQTCETSVLYDGAEQLEGFTNLVRPSPAAVVLLAARGLVHRRGRLTDKSRARLAAALDRDPTAWEAAQRQAAGLGLLGALELLRRTWESDRRPSRAARAAGLAETLFAAGALRSKAKVLLSVRRHGSRRSTVSFSGLDGAGKSTQVLSLCRTLEELGISATAQWAPTASARRLRSIHASMQQARSRLRPSQAPEAPADDPWLPGGFAGSRVGAQAWVAAVTVYNLLKQWRHVLLPRSGASVLVLDRFTPDVAVKLKYHYEHDRGLDVPWQRSLFARLSPKPDVGFLLAVPAEVAHSRAHEWEPAQLAVMAEAYEEQVVPFGLTRLDGTLPPTELARSIATVVWRVLR